MTEDKKDALAAPLRLAEIIREKVKKVILETLPDDTVDAMIEKEKLEVKSQMITMIREEVRKQVKELLAAHLSSQVNAMILEYDGDTNEYKILGEVAEKVGPELLKGALRSYASGLIQIMRNYNHPY